MPIAVGASLHAPPPTPSLSAIVLPIHTADGPVIPVGEGLTHTVVVVTQPVGSVYIMVVHPSVEPPVTIPVEEPIVAMVVLVLVHVPPPPSLSVIVAEIQTPVGPVIGPGKGLTVIVLVIEQPVLNV